MTKQSIITAVETAYADNLAIMEKLQTSALLTDYASLAYEKDGFTVWTNALRAALAENEIVTIPASDTPYGIDDTVIVPSGRKISAYGATILQIPEVRVLMLRNEHTENGTHAPISGKNRDRDIMIEGGTWAESWTRRLGYGRTGMFDLEYSYAGVSTLFYFGNMDRLTVKDVTFRHTAGFSLQCGDITNAMFDTIRFVECYADGLHINGNTKYVLCRDISGQVGDDLVALNMYDWQNSSVNFGPTDIVYCDGLELSADSPYKALRIEPGTYYYDDGSEVDCALTNAVISDVCGIATFKMYYQTPGYDIVTGKPEKGAVGSGDWIYFDNINIDLKGPIDGFPEYRNSDPVRGAFGAFELGSNLAHVSFENIRITLYRDRFPLSYLVVCGPKSCRSKTYEVFDPYLSSTVGELTLKDIYVNGEKCENPCEYVRTVEFDNINDDGFSTGSGKILSIKVI